MRILLLSLAAFQVAHTICPDGFDLVRDGECRGLYSYIQMTDANMSNVAISECAKIQGQPVIIHTAEQQSYWISRWTNPNGGWPIGIVCRPNSSRWVWADGSAIDYVPPSGNQNSELLNGDCTTNCSWAAHPNGNWNKYCTTTSEKLQIYCTVQLKQVVVDDSCLQFDADDEDGVCYQVGETADTWTDAQMNCRKHGANLASIHNLQENSFVRRLAVSNGALNGLFLGATLSGKGGNLSWIDGTPWDYENFHPGFPHAGYGECLAMDTLSPTGQWMNIDCSTNLPVACVRDKITITPSNATCSTDIWRENQVITSPGFPFSAATPCDFYLTADSGKQVEAEIILLEANSCCDYVLIYDGYLGSNLLANITGQVSNVTYTTTSSNIMRVIWEPNGGVNVLGLAMTFRGV